MPALCWLARAGLICSVVLALAGSPAPALAKEPEDVFRGEIITSAKPIPSSSKSKSAYIATLRKLRTTKFLEDRAKKRWKVHYAAFFRTPLNDLEVTIKLYDLSNGARRLVISFEQFLDKRGVQSFTSHMTLEREHFGVNKNLMMVMENRGRILAAGRFAIVGQGEKYSGEVDFTEEETREEED